MHSTNRILHPRWKSSLHSVTNEARCCLRNFEVIGEAAKQVSEKLKQAHSEISWKRIAGLRDVLTHDYIGVDFEEVWRIIERDLPDLKAKIQSLLKENP